jgi:hypothetical protein
MENIRDIIVKHVSEMLDNPDKYGIYPTSNLYDNLENDIEKVIQQELDKYKAKEKELRKYIRNDISEEEFIDTEHYVAILDILDRKDK